jgi:hypothetical protein
MNAADHCETDLDQDSIVLPLIDVGSLDNSVSLDPVSRALERSRNSPFSPLFGYLSKWPFPIGKGLRW